MKYKLLQIKNLEECPYVFMRFKFADNHGFDLSDYTVVYEGEVKDGDPQETLESLFVEFNISHPHDFKGHSLSVSDVVQLGDDYYYCDSLGWVKIEQ